MLSPGQFHKLVPKPALANLQFRKMLLASASSAKVRLGLWEMCRRDILFFINFAVFQINPRHVGDEIGPFISWDFQDEAILATVRQLFGDGADYPPDDMVWEKSREMGATWLAVIIALWLCLFHPNKRVLCMSHSEQAVDQAGNLGSLFAKIRFVLDRLPLWMSERARKRRLSFVFQGGSSISGVASTKRSGVGDRVAMVLLDEFSKYYNAADILGQTRDTGPRLFIGTHYGVGTTYYELCNRPDMHKLIFHWSQHPEKRRGLYRYGPVKCKVEVLDKAYDFGPNFHFVMDGSPTGGPFPGIRSPWYDNECRKRGSARDVAMHLDIDPKGSTSQFFDKHVIESLKRDSVEPWFEGDVDYDPFTGKPHGFVRALGGPIRLWCNLDLDGRPPLARYGGGCDLSAGTGATPTCIAIINAETGQKVLEYLTPHKKPEQMPYIALALCLSFKDHNGAGVKFCWEANGPGLAFGPAFLATGYTNVHYRESTSGLYGDKFAKETTTPGWWMNNQSKEMLLTSYRAALQRGDITNPSLYALDECLSYSYDEQGVIDHSKRKSPHDPSGARENHGDMVIADALAWKMCETICKPQKIQDAAQVASIYTLAGRRLLWESKRRQEYSRD